MTGTGGWKRKLTWGEAADLPLGHGELVYQWNIEPKCPTDGWNLGPADWAGANGLEEVSLIQLQYPTIKPYSATNMY